MFFSPLILEPLEPRRFLSGQLDPHFGVNGITILPGISENEQFEAIGLQSDNKIIAAGNSNGFLLARFLSTGQLDESFGDNGYINLGHSSNSRLTAVRVDRFNDIVVAGMDQGVGAPSDCGKADIFVARVRSDGLIDSPFDAYGQLTASFFPGSSCSASSNDTVNDVLIQADGKIVVAGGAEPVVFDPDHPEQRRDFALARFNTDGSFDDSFGTDGRVILDFGPETCPSPPTLAPCDDDVISSITIDNLGNIIAAGATLVNQTAYDTVLMKFHPDGSLDTGFGDGGKVRIDLGGSEVPAAVRIFSLPSNDIVAPPDLRIVVAGSSGVWGFVARYFMDGSPDTTFGPDRTGMVRPFDQAFGPTDMIFSRDGEITLTDDDLRVGRLFSDGVVDSLFGDGGVSPPVTIPDYPSHYARTLASVPFGIIVAGGASRGDYNVDPYVAKLDLDHRPTTLDLLVGISQPVSSRVIAGTKTTAQIGIDFYGGNGVSGSVPTELYLSTDRLLSSDDVLLPIKLVAFGIFNNTYSFTVPASAASAKPRHYHLIARINNQTARWNEIDYNNDIAASQSFVVVPPKRDLSLSIPSWPQTISRSKPGIISLIIKNLGNVSASGPALLRFFRVAAKNGIPTRSSPFAVVDKTLNLNPGQSLTLRLPLRPPSHSLFGTDYLYVSLDWNGQLNDSKLNNNSVFSPARIHFA